MKCTMPVLAIRGILGALCVILIAFVPTTRASEGTITGVRIAPDSSSVKILFQGHVGKPATVVMGHPYRLVLDFESSELAKVSSKIQAQREPIKQVRMGRDNTRTRVVVDFGENPVPPFRVEREAGHIAVTFGNRLCQDRDAFDRPAATAAKPRPHVETSASTPARPIAKKLPVSIKTTEFHNNVVVVELGDAKNPQQVYRLVLNIDPAASKVRRATLSERPSRAQRPTGQIGNRRVGTLPDPDVDVVDDDATLKSSDATDESRENPKFKWGNSNTGHNGPVKGEQTGQSALKVERYTPPVRGEVQTGSEGDNWDKLTVKERP